jgi:hypothetical protein
MPIHDAFDEAVHAHRALDAPTWTLPLPPLAGNSAEVGETSNRHSAAACVTADRWPLMTMPPLRAIGSGLGAALNCTVPSPCPFAPPLTLSHDVSGAALHWHSRAALTVMLPLPPVAGMVDVALPTVSAHFASCVGDVIVCPDDPHATLVMSATMAPRNSERRGSRAGAEGRRMVHRIVATVLEASAAPTSRPRRQVSRMNASSGAEMRISRLLWVLALAVTLASAVYQRMTGPTYPARGHVVLGGNDVRYRLARSQETTADQLVRVEVPDTAVSGEMVWRRFPSSESPRVVPLARTGAALEATLPRQPPGGKLEYQLRLARPPELVVVPPTPAVTRFKDPVSTSVLIPHVLAMFLGMLWSTRAGVAALTGGPTRALTWTTLALLVVGGFVLGPVMQYQAFGEWWTGVPFGYDLTDNKTLIAIAAWAIAAWRVRAGHPARVTVGLAALVTLVIFAIPHSAWGTQIDWDAAGE